MRSVGQNSQPPTKYLLKVRCIASMLPHLCCYANVSLALLCTSINKNFLQLDQQYRKLPVCRVNRNLREPYLTPAFFSFLLFPTLSSLVSSHILGTISGKGLYRISAFIIFCGYSGLSSCKIK
jgi:hypothetical protein